MTIARDSRTRSQIIACTTDDEVETVYTCPANAKAHMSLLFITNASANDTDIEVKWYRAEDTTSYFILGSKDLGTGEFIQFSDAFIVLEAGDYITVEPSNTAGGGTPIIDVFCTVEEFFLPQQSGVR
jgi:hypothetical protein